MSLGKNKSKIEIYSGIFTAEWEMIADNWYGDDYYGYYDRWDYDPWYCDCPSCTSTWSIREKVYTTHISKRVRPTMEKRHLGDFIDMDSVYEIGTPEYRNRMIGKLLGDEKFASETGMTIGDLFPKK